MALFDKMKDSVTVAGQGVSQKVTTATESVKTNNLIKNNERMIEKLTHQVGIQCVKEHLHEEGTEYEVLFAEIRRLQQDNQQLQQALESLSAGNVCPQCGFSNGQGAKFCISCGSPLQQKSAPAAPVNGKKCPACGFVNDPGSMFCVECGNKLANVQEESAQEIEPKAEPEAEVNVPKCKQCGAVLEEDSLFCTECGTRRE